MDECPTQQKVLSLPYFKQTTMAETRKMTRTPKTSKAKPVDEYGHLQPQAPELEEAVLGALMIEKDAYSLVSEILRPESFYERRHQLIYSAITSLALRQQPVDILTVAEQLRTHRISRTYHRAEVSCTRTDYLYQQHPDKGFRRNPRRGRPDAGSGRKTVRNLAAEHEEGLYANQPCHPGSV